MRHHTNSVVVLGFLAVLVPMSGKAADLTIDRATTYPTIEGLGFFGAADVWWSSPSAVLDQAWTDKVIDDLGISMWRNEYVSEATVQDAKWDTMRPVVQAMVDTAKKRGVKLRIILTVWSPPAAMKCLSDDKLTCNSNPPTRPKDTKGGNILDPAMRADLATWLIAGLQMYQDIGADVYALSFQNEPYFTETYNACVYAQDAYSATLAAVGPNIKAAFPNVKLFGAENMLGIECGKSPGTAFDSWFYTGNILNVAAALSSIDAFAVHGYVDGVSATATSNLASMWTSLLTATAKTGKALWMTETSGYFHTWPGTKDNPGPLDLGQAIYAALVYGNVSAWTYWQGSNKAGYDEYSLMAGADKPGKNYYVSKQFFRFVRPGAQRVDVKSSDPEVMAAAFSHPTMNAFTVVAINTGSASKALTFAGTGLPSDYQVFRTSANEDAAALGTMAADSITLPASSITTLVNGSYRESDSIGDGGMGGTGGATGGGGTTGTGRADAGIGPDASVGGRTGSGGSTGTAGGTTTGGRASTGGATATGGAASGGGAGTTATGGRTVTGGATGGTMAGASGTAGTTGRGGNGGSVSSSNGGKLPDAGLATGGTTAVTTGAGGSGGALPDAAASPTGGQPGVIPDAGLAPAKAASSGCGCKLGGPEQTTSTFWTIALAGIALLVSRAGRKRALRRRHTDS